MDLGNSIGTGFRAFVGGKFTYFIVPIGDDFFASIGNIYNCHGWYLSI